MRIDWARVVGWAIPLGCIALAAYLIFNGLAGLKAASRDLALAQAEENAAAVAKDQAEKESGLMRFAAIPPDKSEEPKFLNGLRGHAATSHISITRWTGHPPEPITPVPTSPGAAPADSTAIDPAVKALVRINGELTLQGPYQGIRDFLSILAKSNRLYTFSDMRWTRKDSDVELTTTITRYVDPTLTPADVVPGTHGRT